MSYDWKERVELSEPDGCGFLLAKDGIAVGGAIYRANPVTCPFLIAPFCDKYEFWNELLRLWKVRDDKLFFDFIPESYCEPLEKAGAKKSVGSAGCCVPQQKRMFC